MTLGQLASVLEDNFQQLVESDIRNTQRNLHKLNEGHEKLKQDVETVPDHSNNDKKNVEHGKVKGRLSKTSSEWQDEDESEDSDINVLGSGCIGHGLRLAPCTGEEDVTFSTCLRKFQGYAEAQTRPWTNRQKARKLKFFLDWLQREEYMFLTGEEKGNFDKTVGRLKEMFESPKMRNMAKQKLMICKQKEDFIKFSHRSGTTNQLPA